jgi:Tol biopolymer transport system component
VRVRRLTATAVVTVAVAGLTVVAPVAPAAANGPAVRVRMVSTSADGEPGDDHSGTGSEYDDGDRRASGDGRHVVFHSRADNLAPPGPTCSGACTDVFVKDLWTGEVVQLSVGTGGAAPDGSSRDPSISPDGRFVVFTSRATNLVPDTPAYSQHVFRHDRESGVTELVTADLGADIDATEPSISDDGQYVSYDTRTWHEDGPRQVYLRDLAAATTTLVSHTANGGRPNGASREPVISGNGRYVAYSSAATDLTAGNDPGPTASQVYRWDRLNDTTVLVSRTSNGAGGDGASFDPSISRDGSVVAFASAATNFGVPNPSGDQVYARDLRIRPGAGPVSLNSGEVAANDRSFTPSISADGRYVAFESEADNLVPGDANETGDVFVRDRWQGTTVRVSLSATGAEPEQDGYSFDPAVTADGTQVVFSSTAENLVPDGNLATDVFIGPANGIQAPVAPLTITGLSCNRTSRATVCTVTYTGGAEQVRIAWTANDSPVLAARNQTTMTRRCPLNPILDLTVEVVLTDDLQITRKRSVATWCA